MKSNWQAVFFWFVFATNYMTAYLINNIQENSNRKNKPLHFTSLQSTVVMMSNVAYFNYNQQKKMQNLSWCCQTICELQFIKDDNFCISRAIAAICNGLNNVLILAFNSKWHSPEIIHTHFDLKSQCMLAMVCNSFFRRLIACLSVGRCCLSHLV